VSDFLAGSVKILEDAVLAAGTLAKGCLSSLKPHGRKGKAMTREAALKQLYERMLLQREDLRRKITEDMGLAHAADDGINDLAETASLVEQTELHSQLAALESRELRQLEAAMQKMRAGHFGNCDRCTKPIPIQRLQALPFTALCVDCQKVSESRRVRDDFDPEWEAAMDHSRKSV
jgi:DnaK suppressor protein